ncbi:hypothetical protein B0H14DRAFT_3767892 [Mycena olivaceomarginata]|nr:hypothetical protein B0H14DRAFT_3767892 [Mycena olivaceomarginata]
MSGTESIPYTSLPFHKKLKAELQAIADAMCLSLPKPTVVLLRKEIQTHMHAHPELADNPQFLPLFAHRTAPNVAGKNSGDKANEEASQVPITSGCNYRRGVKTDPPGQFARLSLNEESGAALSFTAQDNGDESSDSQSLSDSGTGNESPSPEIEKKSSANKQPGAKQVRVPLPDIVRVNFFDVKDPAAEPRQVPVLSNEIPISTITTADGGIVCNTLLDKVLPVAFQNDSPIKGQPTQKCNPEQGGRIYRESHAGRLHIGKIDAIVDGSARPLKINEINTYTLRASTAGQLFCDVFWDAEARGLESENIVEPVAANAPDTMVGVLLEEFPPIDD